MACSARAYQLRGNLSEVLPLLGRHSKAATLKPELCEEVEANVITGAELREALRLLAWKPSDASRRAKLNVRVVRRALGTVGEAPITTAQEEVLRDVLHAAGVEFARDIGDEVNVRLRDRRA